MSVDAYRGQIAQFFSEAVAADDALVNECIGMCKMYNYTVEDLSYKWQALSYSNTRAFNIFTLKSVPDLKATLQQELERQNAVKQESARRNMASISLGRGRGWGGTFPKASGTRGLDAPLTVGPLPSTLVKLEPVSAGPSRVVFDGPRTQSLFNRSYRYMYEKVSERSEALDDRIDEFAELIQKHYSIDELADPSAATEESTTVVGRIVLDAETAATGAKLNESSLVLESSRMMGSGVRVPIRLTPETKLRGGIKGLGGLNLFPGAIVALRGRNGGGGCFLVEEILALPPIKAPSTLPTDASADFSMCIACGPFSLDSDLEYKSWTSLLTTLKTTKPAVVLLLGPFVDVTNSRIKDGDIDEEPKQLFQRQFNDSLKDFLTHSPGSVVILVPSVKDLLSDHAVFPQSELPAELSDDPSIRLLPNPSRFAVNGVSFAVTSVDTLFHLQKEGFFRRTPEIDSVTPASEPATDGMSHLARNVLQQRSFYPCFPAPLDVAHEVNLDVTHSEGIKLIESEDECAPDVLVLPSRLKQFSRVVDNTLVVNPSLLWKGTYATLSYSGKGSGLAKDRITADTPRIS